MKIENIIRRVLREEQEEKRTTGIVDFDGFVNGLYDVEIRHKRMYNRIVLVELIAHPKKNNPYKKDVVFYSTWEPHRNGFKNYDTNSAYTDVVIFRSGSMIKKFNEWAYEESKKYVSKLDRYED
jgi:hypothetical protein